ncbi:MAG: bifunctional diguanylate cyclase/phosphodiesterase [Mobilicoccus sp.]|nr:bifunctional diguanylate cyclase/phosphodiesterase [Mobilicoccus sp.]
MEAGHDTSVRRRIVARVPVLVPVAWALTVAVTTAAPSGPAGVGQAVFQAGCWAAVALAAFVQYFPWRHVLHLATLAAVCMVPVLIEPWASRPLGRYTVADISSLFAILALICLLATIASALDEGAWAGILDIAAAAIGILLAIWVLIVVPRLGADPALVMGTARGAGYAHTVLAASLLALRLRAMPPPLAWIGVAGLAWFVAEVGHFLIRIDAAAPPTALLTAAHLLGSAALVLAFWHPALPALIPTLPRASRGWRRSRLGLAVVAVVAPIVLAALVPDVSDADRGLRTMLAALLLGLLFARLSILLMMLVGVERENRRRAHTDPLTGLLNRGGAWDALAERLVRDRDQGRHTVLVFLDCDDFKQVNDTWGHDAGDTLLIDLAGRLRAATGPNDAVARQGGDEFVIVSSVDDPADAHQLVARVHAVFAEPLSILPGRTHKTSSSIGAACASPHDPVTATDLVARADAAMYAAKRRGKGRACFVDEQTQDERHRRAVADRLGPALERGAIDLVMQPIMGGTGYTHLLGWEALARWQDDALGCIDADVFIPVAEEWGLIHHLGDLVLSSACRHAADVQRAGGTGFVSVNVSPMQLTPDVVDTVRDALTSHGLTPSALRLEVTESVFVQDSPAVEVLQDIRALGVQVYLDDVGSGYASLTRLMRWPVDAIKLGRPLVEPLPEQSASRRLAALLALAHGLGIEDIVAEGVETPEQAQVLSDLGCSAVQGWLYGKPEPVPVTGAAPAHAAQAHDRGER